MIQNKSVIIYAQASLVERMIYSAAIRCMLIYSTNLELSAQARGGYVACLPRPLYISCGTEVPVQRHQSTVSGSKELVRWGS